MSTNKPSNSPPLQGEQPLQKRNLQICENKSSCPREVGSTVQQTPSGVTRPGNLEQLTQTVVCEGPQEVGLPVLLVVGPQSHIQHFKEKSSIRSEKDKSLDGKSQRIEGIAPNIPKEKSSDQTPSRRSSFSCSGMEFREDANFGKNKSFTWEYDSSKSAENRPLSLVHIALASKLVVQEEKLNLKQVSSNSCASPQGKDCSFKAEPKGFISFGEMSESTPPSAGRQNLKWLRSPQSGVSGDLLPNLVIKPRAWEGFSHASRELPFGNDQNFAL